MPGPWFTNRELKRGLHQTVPRDYTLWGNPPQGSNVAADDSPIDSRLLSAPIEHARALLFAIDGTEDNGNLGDPADITAGHKHEESFDGCMPWLQIGSWQHSTVTGGSVVERRAGYKTTSSSYSDVLFVPLCVPIGVTHVYPRFHVEIAASATGGIIKFDFYTFGSYASPSVVGGEVKTFDNSATAVITRRIVETDNRGYDVSGIATTNDYRLIVLRVQVKSLDGNDFILHETQLLPSPVSYRAFPTRDNLDTTNALSDVTLTQSKLATLYVTNPEVLRKKTFGTTIDLPTRSQKHDHGEHRGEVLKRHLFSTSFGPHTREAGAYSPTIGLPLNEPDTGVDFTSTPKLIVRQAFPVLGQIYNVVVAVTGYLSGSSAPRTVGLTIEARLPDEEYETAGAVSGVSTNATFSTASDGFVDASVTLDLSSLGDASSDRIFELCIYQRTNPASTETYRLCGVCAFSRADPDPDLLQENRSLDPLEVIPYTQIRSGQELTGLTIQRAHRILNQCAYEILGGVQGYHGDGKTVDSTKPWYRKLAPCQAHQHRGSYTDASGTKVDDGAVLRYPLLCQHFGFNVSGNSSEDGTSDVNQTRGMKIHASGALNTTDWLYTGGLCTLAQGLGAIEIRALIQPTATNPRARLYCFVSVVEAQKTLGNESDIVTTLSSGFYDGSGNPDRSTSDAYCEVLPEDSPMWLPNQTRLLQGLGCWTQDALRQSSLDSRWLYTHPARWTQPIRAEISPTKSASYRVRVRWALQTGDHAIPGSGTFQSDARILALLVLPARGY